MHGYTPTRLKSQLYIILCSLFRIRSKGSNFFYRTVLSIWIDGVFHGKINRWDDSIFTNDLISISIAAFNALTAKRFIMKTSIRIIIAEENAIFFQYYLRSITFVLSDILPPEKLSTTCWKKNSFISILHSFRYFPLYSDSSLLIVYSLQNWNLKFLLSSNARLL